MSVNICSLLYKSECIKLNILMVFPFPPAFSCHNLENEASVFYMVLDGLLKGLEFNVKGFVLCASPYLKMQLSVYRGWFSKRF